jgi:hypothetical protein
LHYRTGKPLNQRLHVGVVHPARTKLRSEHSGAFVDEATRCDFDSAPIEDHDEGPVGAQQVCTADPQRARSVTRPDASLMLSELDSNDTAATFAHGVNVPPFREPDIL